MTQQSRIINTSSSKMDYPTTRHSTSFMWPLVSDYSPPFATRQGNPSRQTHTSSSSSTLHSYPDVNDDLYIHCYFDSKESLIHFSHFLNVAFRLKLHPAYQCHWSEKTNEFAKVDYLLLSIWP